MSAAHTPRPRSIPPARKVTVSPKSLGHVEKQEEDYLYSDGEEMESHWHVVEVTLLQELVDQHMGERQDYYVGGNMFIHYRQEDALKPPKFRGPDFFFVNGGVTCEPMRKAWLTYRENNRFPDVIIELLSPKTAKADRTTKKDIYEKVFRTREYYLYDPYEEILQGFRLNDQGMYAALTCNAQGWLWSEVLGLWLGLWWGTVGKRRQTWLRFFDVQGRLVPTGKEAEQQHAEEIKQQAEAEIARLKALLQQSQTHPSTSKRKKRPS